MRIRGNPSKAESCSKSKKRAHVALFGLLLLLPLVFSGCGGGATEKGLSEFPNKVDLTIKGVSANALIRGRVLGTEKEPNLLYVKIEISGLEPLPGSQQEVTSGKSLKGSEAVIQVRNPKQVVHQKDSIEALVRVLRTNEGFAFIADDIMVH